jgi:hypothetical protein
MLRSLQRVDLTEREVPTKAWKLKVLPDPSHYATVIDQPSVLYLNGKPAGLYVSLDETEVGCIRAAVRAIEFHTTARTGGLKTTSRVIGYQPRVTVRRDFCTSAALSFEDPRSHEALCEGAGLVSRHFHQAFPEEYVQQAKIVREAAKADWILPNSFYTSGICNWNNLLRYHHDGGNFPGTWNAMLTFKKDIEGGFLAVPELNVALAVRDATLSIFNAQHFLHGVTPFRRLSATAYRYTIVYYALQGLCNCGTPAEELQRIRNVKTDRERRRRSKDDDDAPAL